MVHIYALRTVPEWRASVTAARFAGATLRLGSVAAGILAAATALPDGAHGATAVWLVMLLLAGLGLEYVARRPRDVGGPSAGALLVRGDEVAASQPTVVPMVVGVGIGMAGMIGLGAGPAWLPVLLLAAAMATLALVDVRLRERFYALAPRRGGDAMRPAGAPPAVSDAR
jgi:DMSO reductase anchor subunit